MFRTFRPLLAMIFFAAGCYRYQPIKPTELPKLNGPSVGQIVDGPQSGAAVAVATRNVETPDGRMAKIDGEFDVVVESDGKTRTFEGPLQSTIESGGNGDLLAIKSANFARWSAPLTAVDSVQIKQLDDGKTFLAAFPLVTAGLIFLSFGLASLGTD